MQIHELKTNAPYWWAVDEGLKTFEVRRDDRGFQKGDVLHLLCWDASQRRYMKSSSEHTGDPMFAMVNKQEVTWVLTGGQLGIEPGYVVLGMKPYDEQSN